MTFDIQALTDLRRDFHRFPELGFQEERTRTRIAGFLRERGIEAHAGAGVVGVLRAEAGFDVAVIAGDENVYCLTGYLDQMHMEFGRPTIPPLPRDGAGLLIAPAIGLDTARASAMSCRRSRLPLPRRRREHASRPSL